ncbi:MAG: hypothetical protein BV456_09185 [Thermoplasmata archaeon M8B2D]|nr:MAG: hypothetical protein BV456_09185 [Thermoplasmata archaeon M8B2D]
MNELEYWETRCLMAEKIVNELQEEILTTGQIIDIWDWKEYKKQKFPKDIVCTTEGEIFDENC